MAGKQIKDVPADAFRFEAPLDISAGQDSEARQFEGIAYSGKPILNHWFWGNLSIDLEGIEAPKALPALVGHDRDKIAGFADKVEIDQGLRVAGRLSSASEHGRQVAAISDEGFPWQMSVHADPLVLEEVKAGTEVEVNGHTFSGPGFIFRKSRIREVSFTPTGWDIHSTARAMEHGTYEQSGGDDMTDRVQELEQQVQNLQAQLDEANQRATAEKERAEAAEQRFAATQREHRGQQVKALFAKLGRECTDAVIDRYAAMDEAMFSATMEDLQAAVDRAAQVPEGLFSEQAVGNEGESGQQQGAQNPLQSVMAQRYQ